MGKGPPSGQPPRMHGPKAPEVGLSSGYNHTARGAAARARRARPPARRGSHTQQPMLVGHPTSPASPRMRHGLEHGGVGRF